MVMYCGGFENYDIFLKKHNRPAKTTFSEYYQKKALYNQTLGPFFVAQQPKWRDIYGFRADDETSAMWGANCICKSTNKQPTNQTNQDKPKQSKTRNVSQPQNSSQIPQDFGAAPPPVPRNSNVSALLAPSMENWCGLERKIGAYLFLKKHTLQGTITYPTWGSSENHLQLCHFWGIC